MLALISLPCISILLGIVPSYLNFIALAVSKLVLLQWLFCSFFSNICCFVWLLTPWNTILILCISKSFLACFTLGIRLSAKLFDT